MDCGKSAPARDHALLAVVLVSLACFVYPLALRTPLLDPDEGLHAAISQEMVERGDWLVPRLLGQPFLDKPIFYFWCEAFSLRLLGMDETAVRLPGMLFALLGVATTGLLAGGMFGRSAALLSAAFYATTILPTAMSQSPVHDVALVPLVNLAVLFFWLAQQAAGARGRWTAVAAAGLVLGLSVLTKGLVGVAIVGTGYGAYLILTRRLTLAVIGQGAVALAVAALVAASWYVAMEIRSPGYCWYFLFERHVLGYATTSQRHGTAAWWYYLPVLLLGGLPWSAYLPLYLVRGRTESEDRRRNAQIFLWCWFLVGAALLSSARSKLPTYAWPLFPPAAILAALLWKDLFDGRLSAAAERGLAWTLYGSCAGAPALLLVVLQVAGRHFRATFGPGTWLAAALLGLAACLPGVIFWSGRRRAALGAALASCALQFVWIITWLLPQIAPATSAIELARHFNAQGRIPPRVRIVEERIGSVLFYLDRPLRAGLKPGQIEPVFLEELPKRPAGENGDLVVIPAKWLRATAVHFDLDRAPCEAAGRYRIYDAGRLWSVRR